jgi:hypothetical protein
MSARECWWLFTNDQGGLHMAAGQSAREARGNVLSGIADSFRGEGLSRRQSRQAATSYRVRVVAGPLGRDDAGRAWDAWEREDWETALEHARPHVRAGYGLPPRKRQEAR